MAIRKKRVLIIGATIWIAGIILYHYSSLEKTSGVHLIDIDDALSRLHWPAYVSGGQNSADLADPYNKHAFNIQVSNKLLPDRKIPDVRATVCHQTEYSTNLPQTSIIITFYNEARSALLRTIVSILKRSPLHLIKEIILVDDASSNVFDGSLLRVIPKVRLLRNSQREGLIRSRVKGAQAATGKVLTFLDSHCEVNKGWLEPLLHRLLQNPEGVVTPVIDVIDDGTLAYIAAASHLRGGFDWSLHFKWEPMPSRDKDSRKTHADPIRTPVIAGGLFSIFKERFSYIGEYDTEMEIWGGENLEFSFRTWMCGGNMEIIPCSHVGHIFRKRHPYSFPKGNANTYIRNTRRTAEVWMDQYKRFYFASRKGSHSVEFGNVTDRLQLKKKLGCKSFKWYLENVYPELMPPLLENAAYGQVKQADLCLDTEMGKPPQLTKLLPCEEGRDTQEWSFENKGWITNNGMCLTADPDKTNGYVVVTACHEDESQMWYRVGKTIVHSPSNMCMDSHKSDVCLVLVKCDEMDLDTQEWEFTVEGDVKPTTVE